MRNDSWRQGLRRLLCLLAAIGLSIGLNAWPRALLQSPAGTSQGTVAIVSPTDTQQSSSGAKPVFEQGLKDLERARNEQAIAEFRQALELDPSLMTARYDLGVAYFSLQQFAESRPVFEAVLRQDPKHNFARYFLARVDLILGNLDAAIRNFQALPRDKPVADELYYLGFAYFRKGEIQQAVRTLERAAAAKPADYRIRLLLARCYEMLGRKGEMEREYALSEKIRENYHVKSQEILECHSALFVQFPQDPGPGIERTQTISAALFAIGGGPRN